MEHFLILVFTINGCISLSTFAFLFGMAIEITNSAVGWKICSKTAGIKRYQSIIKQKKKKDDKIVLLAKSKSSSIEV